MSGPAGHPNASPCSGPATLSPGSIAGLAATVAMTCQVDRWLLGYGSGAALTPLGAATGAEFQATSDGLRGISVWLGGAPGSTVLTLRPFTGDGRTLGPPIAQVTGPKQDANGLWLFDFPTIGDSAGRRYAFDLRCGVCRDRAEIDDRGESRPRGRPYCRGPSRRPPKRGVHGRLRPTGARGAVGDHCLGAFAVAGPLDRQQHRTAPRTRGGGRELVPGMDGGR